MNQLFSKGSLMILESLSFTNTLYVFDFDGTLSKIVRVPSAAVISKSTTELLQKLSEKVPIAVISGRSIDDLKKRLTFKPRYLIGNHGIEGLESNQQSLNKAEEDSKSWKKALERLYFDSGIEIEDKTYSLAIHYRRSRNKKEARESIQSSLAKLEPAPRVIRGKYVFNLLPSGAPHKGIAVLELMKKVDAKHALYIGDDDTDEDVFSLPNENLMTIRVGEKRASDARYYIKRQSEMNRVLKLLLQYNTPRTREKKDGA